MTRKPAAIPLRSEAAVQREALAIFRSYGFDMQRRNTRTFTVAGKGGRPRPMFCGEPGDSDLTGMVPGDGRRIDVEVKREGWRPSRARGNELAHWRKQLAKLRRANELGGVGMWLDDPSVLHHVIPKLLAGWHVELDEDGNQWISDEPREETPR